MTELRVHNFSISLDGYGAGPGQGVDNPLGVGGEQLHEWLFPPDGERTAVDQAFRTAGERGIGANIMGRNMFGPIRGDWPDDEWKGWWGDEPPYHNAVFVLTHHAREPIEMQGGTTFYFVTDGIESAYKQAFDAAGGKDVRLNGGASTIRQYMRAGLLDELHVTISPILLGGGERVFDDVGDASERYECVEFVAGNGVTHARLRRR